MKKLKSFVLLILFSLLLGSCKKEEANGNSKAIDIMRKSDSIFNDAIALLQDAKSKINIDSVTDEYERIKQKKPQLALNHASKLKDYAIKVDFDKIDKDAAVYKKEQEISAREEKEWQKSKAGKLQKSHPNWTREDCRNLVNKKIWLGMTIEMLRHERGKPDSTNPSNYGNGVQYQWCWYDYSPSCFYGGENGIITSYN